VANSEISSIYLRQVLENLGCQLGQPSENEFATSISTSFTSVRNYVGSVQVAPTIMREMHEQSRNQPQGQAIVHRDMLGRRARHARKFCLTWGPGPR
jgi:hypothetical protein